MDQEMQEFVQRHLVKELPKKTIDRKKLQAQSEELEQAGFTSQAYEMSKQLTEDRIFEQLSKNRLLLKAPYFEQSNLRHISNKIFWILGSAIGIPLFAILGFNENNIGINAFGSAFIYAVCFFGAYLVPLIIRGLFVIDDLHYNAVKMGRGKWLVECSPNEYRGYVAEGVPAQVIKAKGMGLSPHLWVIGTRQDIRNMVRIQKDPLLVAYIKESSDYAILLAAFGKDLEDLDKYFGKTT